MADDRCAWERLGARDPSKLSVEELQKEKKACLEEIQRFQKEKAPYQARLSSSNTSEGVKTREMLEELVLECESHILLYQQHETACQTELLKYKALTSPSNRTKFSQSTKQESVACNTLSGTMSGFAGSGKTHTLAMVTREQPPSLRVSTPLCEVPTRTITQTRIGKDGADFTKICDKDFTDSVLLSAKESVSSAVTSVSFKIKSHFRKLVSKPSEPTDPVERELIAKFGTLDDEHVMSLADRVVMEISDCGGQPQFLEILPRYIESIDFSILVTNLSQCFNEHPINYFFNSEGKSVGEGVPSPLNNEQVIRLHLQMIASLSQEDRRAKIVVVGTHRDLEGKMECTHAKGQCIRSREEKNQRLKEMVESFGLEDSVISRTHSEIIFAINAKTPEEVDYQTIDHLMNCILKECPSRKDKIPLSYYALELTLKSKAHESGHIAFCESTLLKEMLKYHLDELSFKSALRYLHKKRRVIYYEKMFPGRILGEPQAVLNKQTELVVYNIQLASVSETLLDKEQWRFVKYGFLNIGCLKKFPDHYVEGVFTPDDMLKLFVKLLMVSEVGKGEYLMPCVLPTDPLANCNPEPDTQSVPPMVLYFPGGPARYGVFCGTICHVMTKSKWKLLMEPVESDQPYHITRNSVHFCLPDYLGKVTLNDPFDSFFVVTVHVPDVASPYSEVVCYLCMKVRDTLLDAIAKVTAKLNYGALSPTVAFLCTKHDDLHPATMSARGDNLLCTHARNTKGGTLTAGHRVWLRDSSAEPYPDLTPPTTPNKPAASLLEQRDTTSSISLLSDTKFALSSHQSDDSSTIDYSFFMESCASLASPCKQPATTLAIGAKPLLHQLVLLKVGERRKRIIEEVGVDWEKLAYVLEFDQTVVDTIKDDNRGMNEKSCQDMFRRWLDGGACQPVTWERLLEAIRDIPRDTLAAQVEELIELH